MKELITPTIEAIIYTPRNGGRIYISPFQCKDRTMVSRKAFCTKDILPSYVGRNQMTFNQEEFPHIPESTLVKVR